MDSWDVFLAVLRKITPSSFIDWSRGMELYRAIVSNPLQDPTRFLARFLGLECANALVDEEGELQWVAAERLLQELDEKQYLIGPNLENEAFIIEHLRISIRTLLGNQSIQKLFQRFSPPLCHRGAEQLVRDTLWPLPLKAIHSYGIKRAVLAAWFTWLRQTTGSCFATAPAILIQKEQPIHLIQDLFDLLTFGALRRVISGKEYAVPLCPSLNNADLLRPISGYSAEDLAIMPGFLAAFSSCHLFSPDLSVVKRAEKLRKWISSEKANTPKELIEQILQAHLGLKPEDIHEEEALKKFEMTPLLVKQSAIYYQKPSERATKVSLWREKLEQACSAYQNMCDSALLRAWESTVASFSDVKVDIGKWNLYVSLGLHPDYTGGVGAFVYDRINERLQILNQKIQENQIEYDQAMQAAKRAERMQHSGEVSSSMYKANVIIGQTNQLSQEAERISTLFSFIIQNYDHFIPEYFQEIFDPSLAQNLSEIIDDSPAGFRLAYKHGRSISSKWTFIRSSDEFISSLREFFTSVEQELKSLRVEDKAAIEEVSTALIQFIQTSEFLAMAMTRAKTNPAMSNPNSKPWEYVSGGTMSGLLMVYYSHPSSLSVFEKLIRSESELLSFLYEGEAEIPKQALLMHSPTHAFIFHSEWLPPNPMKAIKDMEKFWKSIEFIDESFLAEKFSTRLPKEHRPLFLHRFHQKKSLGKILDFREFLLESAFPQLVDKEGFVDGFLYESLPHFDAHTAILLAMEISKLSRKNIELLFSNSRLLTPLDFRELLKRGSPPFNREDLDEKIAEKLRQNNLAPPKPIFFADTNWSQGIFGLAFSPIGDLSLWRFARTGMRGVPMRKWFQLQCNQSWFLFNRPEQYKRDFF